MLDGVPDALLIEIGSYLDADFVLSSLPLLSTRWSYLSKQVELHGVLSLPSHQTEGLLSRLPCLETTVGRLGQTYTNAPSTICFTESEDFVTRILNQHLDSKSTRSDKFCNIERIPLILQLYRQFRSLSGIQLQLRASGPFSCRRQQLLFLLTWFLPNSIRHLNLSIAQEDSITWLETNDAENGEVRTRVVSTGKNRTSNPPNIEVFPIARQYVYLLPKFQDFDSKETGSTPSSAVVILGHSSDRFDSRWLYAEDWNFLFKRLQLDSLSVTLSSYVGFLARPCMELKMPAIHSSDTTGIPFLLHSLKHLEVSGITSCTFSVDPHCTLPSLRFLRLGFIEVNIRRHDIRSFFNLPAAYNCCLDVDEAVLGHPIEELRVHLDGDDDEQLRLALVVNRLIDDTSPSRSTQQIMTEGSLPSPHRHSAKDGNSSNRSIERFIRFPRLRCLQIPRIGLISPSLPLAAPYIEELLSFESWEFQSITRGLTEEHQFPFWGSSDLPSSCEVFDSVQYNDKHLQPLSSTRSIFRCTKRKISKPQQWNTSLFRRWRYQLNLSIDNRIRCSSKRIANKVSNYCRSELSSLRLPSSSPHPSQDTSHILCRPPSVIRLQQLLDCLPYISRVSFFKELEQFQLRALQSLIASSVFPSAVVIRSSTLGGEVRKSQSDSCKHLKSTSPLGRNSETSPCTEGAQVFYLTAGVELERFFRLSY